MIIAGTVQETVTLSKCESMPIAPHVLFIGADEKARLNGLVKLVPRCNTFHLAVLQEEHLYRQFCQLAHKLCSDSCPTEQLPPRNKTTHYPHGVNGAC